MDIIILLFNIPDTSGERSRNEPRQDFGRTFENDKQESGQNLNRNNGALSAEDEIDGSKSENSYEQRNV